MMDWNADVGYGEEMSVASKVRAYNDVIKTHQKRVETTAMNLETKEINQICFYWTDILIKD